MSREEDVGLRKNEGKPHVELCPGIVNELIGTVLWESAAPRGKYPMNNWRQGLKWLEEVLGSLERHLNSLKEGEDIDPESGLPHIAHLLTNGMFLAYYMEHGLGEDDRPKKPVSEVEAIGGKNCGEGAKEVRCGTCALYPNNGPPVDGGHPEWTFERLTCSPREGVIPPDRAYHGKSCRYWRAGEITWTA